MIEKTIMERRGIKKANDAPISRETVNTILEQVGLCAFSQQSRAVECLCTAHTC